MLNRRVIELQRTDSSLEEIFQEKRGYSFQLSPTVDELDRLLGIFATEAILFHYRPEKKETLLNLSKLFDREKKNLNEETIDSSQKSRLGDVPDLLVFVSENDLRDFETCPIPEKVREKLFTLQYQGDRPVNSETIHDFFQQKDLSFGSIDIIFAPDLSPRKKSRQLEQIDSVHGLSLLFHLSFIATEKVSGVINTTGISGDYSSLYFKDGQLSHILSNAKNSTLGHILCELELVTKSDLEKTASLKGPLKIGQKLINAGLINEENLSRALQMQSILRLSELASQEKMQINFTTVKDEKLEDRGQISDIFPILLNVLNTGFTEEVIQNFFERFRCFKFVRPTVASDQKIRFDENFLSNITRNFPTTFGFLTSLPSGRQIRSVVYSLLTNHLALQEIDEKNVDLIEDNLVLDYLADLISLIDDKKFLASFPRFVGVDDLNMISHPEFIRSLDNFRSHFEKDLQNVVSILSLQPNRSIKEIRSRTKQVKNQLQILIKHLSETENFHRFEIEVFRLTRARRSEIAETGGIIQNEDYFLAYNRTKNDDLSGPRASKLQQIFNFGVSRLILQLGGPVPAELKGRNFSWLIDQIPVQYFFKIERRVLRLLIALSEEKPDTAKKHYQKISHLSPKYFSDLPKMRKIIVERLR